MFGHFFVSTRMPLWITDLLLGIIEGITEFIPISSTGHLIIAEKVFELTQVLPRSHWLVQAGPLKDLFNVVIQSGQCWQLPLFPTASSPRLGLSGGPRQDHAIILLRFWRPLPGTGGRRVLLKRTTATLTGTPCFLPVAVGGGGRSAVPGGDTDQRPPSCRRNHRAHRAGGGAGCPAAVFPDTIPLRRHLPLRFLFGRNRVACDRSHLPGRHSTMLAARD
jgi:hypothetical protein